MPDEKKPAPDATAMRTALWRAMHVQLDSPPHVFEDEIGLELALQDEGWRARQDMDPQWTRRIRGAIVARARFVEDLVAEQVARGIGQYVILGAGLDTFAQRKPEIASRLRVFEVDRPGPQEWKRQRLVDLGYGIPSFLRFVPVDFEAGASWWERLVNAGFDTSHPAIVVSTGVSIGWILGSLICCAPRAAQPPVVNSVIQPASPSTSGPSVPSPLAAVPRAGLLADLGELRALLEASHPDPYLRAGGVVEFRLRFADAELAIPENGMTRFAFYRLVRPLAAQVGDGHTTIFVPGGWRKDLRVWTKFGVVERRLVVIGVYREADRAFLGATVKAVDGVAAVQLAQRMASRFGNDNEYQNLARLAVWLSGAETAADVLDRAALPGSLRFDLELPGGNAGVLLAPIGTEAPMATAIEAPTLIAVPPSDAAGMASGFLDSARRTAYFRMDSSLRYREAFESWRSQGISSELGETLDAVVREVTGREPEGDVEHRIRLVPSVVERLKALFSEMRKHHTSKLVVDVRNNGGGHSLYATILEYFLYPYETILTRPRGYEVQRYSKLHFDHVTGETLEQVRERTSPHFAVGDFDFTEERRYRLLGGKVSAAELEERKRELEEEIDYSPTCAELRRSEQWNAAWTPRVVVVTSAATFSSGFDVVLALRGHGAAVAGVPSGQAANRFIEALPFALTHSGVHGQLSSKLSVELPGDEVNGTVLHPDYELTYAAYASLGFDPNASLRLAMTRD